MISMREDECDEPKQEWKDRDQRITGIGLWTGPPRRYSGIASRLPNCPDRSQGSEPPTNEHDSPTRLKVAGAADRYLWRRPGEWGCAFRLWLRRGP